MGNKKSSLLFLAILFFLLLITIVVSLSVGAITVWPFDLLKELNPELLKLRLARVILGVIVGASLSVAGCILQGLLRNPLAEPYSLGISSGAGLGGVIAIVSGGTNLALGIHSLPLFAFIGAVATMALVYNLARIGGRIPIQSLILAGVIVGAVFSSILLFLISFTQNELARDALWWLLGNLQIYDMKLLIVASALSLSGIIAAQFFARELNIISLGEEEAIHLGINIETVKKILFVAASLITASSVASCGMIGFVGLIIPHLMRFMIGPDHRSLIPGSALLGAIFLVICDTFARTVLLPAEIPIGAITAIIGGPFFIYLMRSTRKMVFK